MCGICVREIPQTADGNVVQLVTSRCHSLSLNVSLFCPFIKDLFYILRFKQLLTDVPAEV